MCLRWKNELFLVWSIFFKSFTHFADLWKAPCCHFGASRVMLLSFDDQHVVLRVWTQTLMRSEIHANLCIWMQSHHFISFAFLFPPFVFLWWCYQDTALTQIKAPNLKIKYDWHENRKISGAPWWRECDTGHSSHCFLFIFIFAGAFKLHESSLQDAVGYWF